MKEERFKEYTIFVGTPGVGKSTILNGLLGQTLFHQRREGEENLLQLHQIGETNEYLGETRGLLDEEAGTKAAEEISKILQLDGFHRLVFVVTFAGGGYVNPIFRKACAAMLQKVNPNIPFAILINRATGEDLLHFEELSFRKTYLETFLSESGRSTEIVGCIECDYSLYGKGDVVLSNGQVDCLRKFLEKIPYLKVRSVSDSDNLH